MGGKIMRLSKFKMELCMILPLLDERTQLDKAAARVIEITF